MSLDPTTSPLSLEVLSMSFSNLRFRRGSLQVLLLGVIEACTLTWSPSWFAQEGYMVLPAH